MWKYKMVTDCGHGIRALQTFRGFLFVAFKGGGSLAFAFLFGVLNRLSLEEEVR
jgi:hypothetical protein